MTSDTGKNVVAAVEQFRKLYREIGRLLEHADEQMANHGWQARGSQSFSGSSSLNAPDKWLPVVVFRLYYHKQKKNLMGFVSAIIADPEVKGRVNEPLISAGWCDYGVGRQANEGLLWGWTYCHLDQSQRADDGTVIIEDDKEWLETPKFGVVRYGSMALPLFSIMTAEDLRNRVIDPLLAAINKAGVVGVLKGNKGKF